MTILCYVLAAVAASASASPDRPLPRVGIHGSEFILLDDARPVRAFEPWGFNYDRQVLGTRDVLLVETLAQQPDKVAKDLAAMRALGGNVARVFIATSSLLEAPDRVRADGLRQVDLLLEAAAKARMRLIVVGLANLAPAEAPPWMQNADDETMHTAERLFWQTLAKKCRGRPEVFAYDLQNEPAVHGDDNREWVIGCFEMSAGRRFCYVHMHYRQMRKAWAAHVKSRFTSPDAVKARWADFPRDGESLAAPALPTTRPADPRRADFESFKNGLLRDWAVQLADAVREVDRETPITIGALAPQIVAPAVDFHCFHLYPHSVPKGRDFRAENIADWTALLARVTDGKPVVIEEFYPLVGGAGASFEQIRDMLLEATRPRAVGYVSFYWGDPEEMNWPNPIAKAIYADWLRIWAQGRGK